MSIIYSLPVVNEFTPEGIICENFSFSTFIASGFGCIESISGPVLFVGDSIANCLASFIVEISAYSLEKRLMYGTFGGSNSTDRRNCSGWFRDFWDFAL